MYVFILIELTGRKNGNTALGRVTFERNGYVHVSINDRTKGTRESPSSRPSEVRLFIEQGQDKTGRERRTIYIRPRDDKGRTDRIRERDPRKEREAERHRV